MSVIKHSGTESCSSCCRDGLRSAATFMATVVSQDVGDTASQTWLHWPHQHLCMQPNYKCHKPVGVDLQSASADVECSLVHAASHSGDLCFRPALGTQSLLAAGVQW